MSDAHDKPNPSEDDLADSDSSDAASAADAERAADAAEPSNTSSSPAPRSRRRWAFGLIPLALVALWFPDGTPDIVAPADYQPFIWGADPLWESLEHRFDEAREAGCEATTPRLDGELASLDEAISAIDGAPREPDDPAFTVLEQKLFETATLFGACPARIVELVPRLTRLRTLVKHQSEAWDPEARASRDRVYRLLYGSRAALEELILQAPEGNVPALIHGTDEPSETPSTVVEGVRVHSGDILVSRGGAMTSAFIARGNDYPGNFSHIAMLHVSEEGVPSVIESHIENGVVITSAADYLEDVKLRIMVLRPRADLPELVDNPMLPHIAATAALETAQGGHVPYDFRMDFVDHERQFCSEVPAAVYEDRGVRLWQGLSSMSSQGLTRWLSVLGVTEFETLNPSDLEYDPQLRVVAEWRDVDTLFHDHVDNAILDALLERAEAGEEVDYEFYMLGPARVLKGYSVLATLAGSHGPVPEGMTATTGLRVEWIRARHDQTRARLDVAIEEYRERYDRRPPYWRLLALAREASRPD
ncbi:MAG: YiiX/YebB-like N1pC/P60 family cysteine hydrolase [Sandaracinaceae bacterium]